MLKLLSFVLLLMICGGIQSINGEALQCKFGDVPYFGTFYSCSVTALENPNDNIIITGYSGVHQANKNDRDVKEIYISEKDTYFIPECLGSFFNITALVIRESKLKEIRSKDFQGMQNLDHLSLLGNKLTSVPSDIFSTLTKLKLIWLDSNQIRYIGSSVFDQLMNLNRVDLKGNICISQNFQGTSSIIQMKHDIKLTCDKPNDIIQYEIEQKITNKLKELRSELHQEHNEIRNDRIEIIKLQSELSTAKDLLETAQDEQKTEQEANMKVITERDQLKKELSKAKETIEDFYMEVMDLKIECHYKREDLIALRSKLMEAKEQLAECKINERILC